MPNNGAKRQNDFRQMCVIWMRQNMPDVIAEIYKELDKRYPVKRPTVKLPKSLQKKAK